MKIRPVHVVAVLLVIAGGFLAYESLSSSVNPYLTVSQASGDPANLRGEVQVLATLSSWSVDDRGTLHLVITDGNATMGVRYSGIPPQGLQGGQSIVAIGTLDSPGSLNASRLLVKCPSKYEQAARS